MVQWLGLGAFTAVAQVQSLVGKLRYRKLSGLAKGGGESKYIYTHTHIYIYTHTHTYTHTHIYVCVKGLL